MQAFCALAPILLLQKDSQSDIACYQLVQELLSMR